MTMITRKNRLMSFILANIMVLTMIFGIIPPLEVHAISPEEGGDGNLYISSPSQDDDINGYEDITIRWNRVSGAHHYWLTVKDTVKGTNLFNKNVGTKTSYTFSYDDDIFVTDGRVYKIYVAAMDSSGKVLNGAADWNAIYVTNYLELDYDIEVETIDTDGEQTMNTLEMCAELYIDSNVDIGAIQVGFEFGVKGGTQKKTNATRGYYDGDEFGWTLTGLEPGKSYTYRGYAIDPVTREYIFGDRITITTLDEEDFLPEVYTDSATDITLTSAVINGELEFTADLSTEYGFILGTGVTEQVKIGSSASEKSFEYEWEYLQPNTQYTYKTYAKNKYGTVYGNTKTFTTQSDITKPVIEVLKSSLGNEFTYGSTVTFTAEASDNVALSEFILYVDNTQVDYSDYYTDYEELEYTTSSLSEGTHTIKAYAVDDGGNEATKTLTVTVKEAAPIGVLGDVNSDDAVTNLDRYILYRYLNGNNISINSAGADINRDGSIKEDDYVLLSNHLSKMSGYEDLYVFSNTTQAKPVLTGIQDRYTVKKGESLNLSFSVNALSGGLVEKITLKHNLTGTTFAPISYTTNKGTYSNVFNISGYPLNTIGTYDFIVYCRANNYTITDNAIYRFTVDVIDSTCTHPTEAINDVYKSTVYDSAVNSSNTHTYHHTYTSKCTNCGTSLGTVNSEYFTESHSINKKGYCLCGYIDNSGYSSWGAYNTSAGRTIVYRNPEATGYYGEIYADESVTVVGECCDRYLIKYSVSGGTKMGYVNKDALYRTFTFNGNTIKLYDVIGTTRLYANASELMSQIYGMYDRKSDDTATLIYYRTQNTDSAVVINVDLSNANDWDGITFSVKGINNQIIGYILTTKLNGEHYIDVNKFLEYASISSYNQEKSSNEQQLLHLTLIRDYDEITFSEDAFDSDSVMKKILYKGGIGAIIDGVQNIMDLSSGGVVNGTDIMDTMVLNMISSKQDSLIDMAIECTEALDTIKGVYEKINTANSGVSPLMPQKFSYFLEELSAMSDTEFNSMLGSQIIGEASNNKELSAFLSRYGLSIENFPIDKVGNIRKAVKSLETLDTINKIITPLLDGTNRYLTHKKISDNFKGDIKDQLLLLKNTATDQRVKNTIQTYITNIESGNYDSIFNVSEAWAAAGYTVEYLASNKDIIKNAYNFTYKLSQNGFFGSKIASAAAKMNGSEFMGIVKGVASADTLLSAPSTIMGIVGYDCSSAYDIEVNLVTVSSALRDTRNKFASATFGTKEYSDYFTACNLWVDKLISLVNDYCNCFPNDITGDLKTEIDKYQAIHTNNRARMQSLIN